MTLAPGTKLAHYEIVSGRTPPKVVINEAVELAKEFSTEKSPLFINGVLDKIYKSMRAADEVETREEPEATEEPEDAEETSREPARTVPRAPVMADVGEREGFETDESRPGIPLVPVATPPAPTAPPPATPARRRRPSPATARRPRRRRTRSRRRNAASP